MGLVGGNVVLNGENLHVRGSNLDYNIKGNILIEAGKNTFEENGKSSGYSVGMVNPFAKKGTIIVVGGPTAGAVKMTIGAITGGIVGSLNTQYQKYGDLNIFESSERRWDALGDFGNGMVDGAAFTVGGLLTLVSGKTVYNSGISIYSAAKEGDSAGIVVHSMNGILGLAGIYGGVKIYRTPTVGVGQILENKNIPSGKTQNSSNSKILEQLKTYMKNGKNIITQVDDKTKIIFRRDIGPEAHSIRPKYVKPVDHYNIEIQSANMKG